jgi:hypothetical protein
MADDVVVQEVCANLLGAVFGLGSWVLGLRSQVSGLGCWTSKPRGFGHAAWEERGRRTGQLGTLARPCSSARKHVQATLFRRGVDMRRILFDRATG